jgi:hypothetical protein
MSDQIVSARKAPLLRRRKVPEQAEEFGRLQRGNKRFINYLVRGGGRGIRTLDTVSRIHAFQACAFSRSATPPHRRRHYSGGRGRDNVALRPARNPPGDVGRRAPGRKDADRQRSHGPVIALARLSSRSQLNRGTGRSNRPAEFSSRRSSGPTLWPGLCPAEQSRRTGADGTKA